MTGYGIYTGRIWGITNSIYLFDEGGVKLAEDDEEPSKLWRFDLEDGFTPRAHTSTAAEITYKMIQDAGLENVEYSGVVVRDGFRRSNISFRIPGPTE